MVFNKINENYNREKPKTIKKTTTSKQNQEGDQGSPVKRKI